MIFCNKFIIDLSMVSITCTDIKIAMIGTTLLCNISMNTCIFLSIPILPHLKIADNIRCKILTIKILMLFEY